MKSIGKSCAAAQAQNKINLAGPTLFSFSTLEFFQQLEHLLEQTLFGWRLTTIYRSKRKQTSCRAAVDLTRRCRSAARLPSLRLAAPIPAPAVTEKSDSSQPQAKLPNINHLLSNHCNRLRTGVDSPRGSQIAARWGRMLETSYRQMLYIFGWEIFDIRTNFLT